jgi:hypothetical protein
MSSAPLAERGALATKESAKIALGDSKDNAIVVDDNDIAEIKEISIQCMEQEVLLVLREMQQVNRASNAQSAVATSSPYALGYGPPRQKIPSKKAKISIAVARKNPSVL